MLIGGMDEPTAARVRSNVQIISEGYVHFNDGDIEWMCEHLSPGIVWDDSKNVPGTKTYQGIEEVRAYIRAERAKWSAVVKDLGLEGSQ